MNEAQRLYRELTKAVESFRNLAQQDDPKLRKEAAQRLLRAAERAAEYIERS